MYVIRFCQLSAGIPARSQESHDTLESAKDAVASYARAFGFTRVKAVEEEMGLEYRFTATTPKGRAGRTVAYATLDMDMEE